LVMAQEISSQEAEKALSKGDAVLLDVRHREEVDFTKAEPMVWIDLTELPGRFAELPKNKMIICLCRTGSRSSTAADFLARQGYNAMNLHGGIFEWSKTRTGLRKYAYTYSGNEVKIFEIK